MRRLLALLLIPTAMACTQDDPCTIPVVLDPDGMHFAPDEETHARDQWDWVVFSIQNRHTEEHTLFLEHYGIEMDAPGAQPPPGAPALPGTSSHGPYRLTDHGSFTLEDMANGRTLELEIIETARPATPTTQTSQEPEPTQATETEPAAPRTKEISAGAFGPLAIALALTVRRLSGAP